MNTKSSVKDLAIGYLVPEFPSQTHSFFWREIVALRALGVDVQTISTRKVKEGSCLHEFASEAISQTHYLFPPDWAASLFALISRPIQTFKALRYLAGLRESSIVERLSLLWLLIPAADMFHFSRRIGISHIHVHSCANAAHIAAICRLLGGPSYSLTLHGDLPVYGKDHSSKVRLATFVACVTKQLQKQLCDSTGLPKAKAPILWMGVNTNHFFDFGNRQPMSGEMRVLTVARLNATKGHRYALQAIRTALKQGIRLIYMIAGEGPERISIEREIEQLELQKNVQLLGTQSEAQILELLQNSDVLVLPSFGPGEAAPVSVMEAMSCGLPVICSIIGGTSDMIEDGVNGFLVPQMDVTAISEALISLSTNLDLRKQMGKAARKHAELAFDSSTLATKMLGLLRRNRASN